jgi:putative hydrolase of the HAD superfamily
MLAKPVEPLPGVRETLEALSGRYALMLVTKGDLFDQEAKLARSGLGERFSHVEIVSEKTPDTYAAILKRHGVKPGHFCMVGNSLKSDVLPAVRIGARGVHVPYAMTWVHEQVEGAAPHSHGYAELASITELPALLARWEAE